MLSQGCLQRLRFGNVAVFEKRQPVTEAKFINKSSLFILLLGVILRLELKPIRQTKSRGFVRRPAIAKPPILCSPFILVCGTEGMSQRSKVCPGSGGTWQALLQDWLMCVGFVCLANVADLVRIN